MENNPNNIPLSFKTIHQELKTCTVQVGKLFKENLPESFGFKKENLDSIYSLYEIWFFLLSGIDIRCHSFLKNNEVRERLFNYFIDEMFSDLGIETAKEKNIIVGAMNIRLEEYGDVLQKSKTAEEMNKGITLLFIQKFTHAVMKKEFLNEPSLGLFPLQEGPILEVSVHSIFYIKIFNTFLDSIFATNEQFSALDENRINIIKNEAYEKRKEFLEKIAISEKVMKQNLFGSNS